MFGVPQGSILETLLFNTFLCDVFFIINDVKFASYADDNTPFLVDHDLNVILKLKNALQKHSSNGLITTKWKLTQINVILFVALASKQAP